MTPSPPDPGGGPGIAVPARGPERMIHRFARLPPAARAVARGGAFSDGLLAMSIILTGASAFRLGGLPLGPGEACLLAWIGIRAGEEVLFRPSPASGLASAIVAFWLVFAAAQCVGLLRALTDRIPIDWPLVAHDGVAFTIMALFSILCLCHPEHAPRLRRTTRFVTLIGSAMLTLQTASAWDLVAIPGIDPWYWDRFRGWSDNPNQLSLFCAVLIPIALFDFEYAEGPAARIPAVCCGIAALVAGMLTKGNSLRLALVAGAACSLAVLVVRLLARRAAAPRRGTLALALVVACTPLGTLALVPLLATLRTDALVEQVSRDGVEIQSEAALRFELWEQAFLQGLNSAYLGLGPGPHARVPPIVVVRQRWEPGANDPTLGDVAKHGAVMESHNTYLELFSQGGLPIVVAYGALLAFVLHRSLRSGSVMLPAIVCVIAVFGIFHVQLRHPIVWFGLCLCAGSGPPVPRTLRPAPR